MNSTTTGIKRKITLVKIMDMKSRLCAIFIFCLCIFAFVGWTSFENKYTSTLISMLCPSPYQNGVLTNVGFFVYGTVKNSCFTKLNGTLNIPVYCKNIKILFRSYRNDDHYKSLIQQKSCNLNMHVKIIIHVFFDNINVDTCESETPKIIVSQIISDMSLML